MLKAVVFDFGHTLMDEVRNADVSLGLHPAYLMPCVRRILPRIPLPMGVWANTTTAREHEVRRWLSRAGIGDYFDWVVTSVDAGHRKPDRRFFACALRECGFKPHEVLFVGNQRNTDIRGARDYGIPCVWIVGRAHRSPDDAENHPARPNYVIQSLSELPGLARKLLRLCH